MGNFYSNVLRPLLFRLDPELAHSLAACWLKTGAFRHKKFFDSRLKQELAGVSFPNPLGMAAGFDKNGKLVDKILQLGFGFSEVGTVTPKPQSGNAKPRLFRLEDDQALINRMGFNNEGYAQIYRNLLTSRQKEGIFGVNLGANKDSQNRLEDYIAGIKKFYNLAYYFTINISSPNTPGLRNLQQRDHLQVLLSELSKAREAQREISGKHVPIFLKIAPDLGEEDIEIIAEEIKKTDFEGLVVSNTTIERKNLKSPLKQEMGGLSGAPLFIPSTILLAKLRKLLGKKLVLIAAGGVKDMESFLTKIKAGADLVQLYSAFVFEGVSLATNILQAVLLQMEKDKVKHISDYRDCELETWSKKSLC